MENLETDVSRVGTNGKLAFTNEQNIWKFTFF